MARRASFRYFWACLSSAAAFAQSAYVGSEVCATCHPAIAASYRRTAMARTSGAIDSPLPSGSFQHAASNTRYSIEGATVRFSSGERTLRYFIGSAAAGRSYLMESGGFLFLAPVTWYAGPQRWDMSPGYQKARHNLWNRAIEPNCLFCHSTRPQSILGTQNRYATPPFVEGGIGCERCHGPGAEHAAGARPAAIVNPRRLAPGRRDSVCAQCHLTGQARIDLPGKQIALYRPGDDLFDFVSVYVSASPAGGLRVTSHVEKLSYSACRNASDSALWCGSCHDPHSVPAPAERDSWYRSKCLNCHGSKLAAEHAARSDCTACHMPRTKAADANHGVFTDHSIPRLPSPPAAPRPAKQALIPFPGSASNGRSLGLAYAEAALESNDVFQQREAIRLLRAALDASPADWNLLTRLAYLEEPSAALALYERSLRIRPAQPVALVNAGTLHARQGNLTQAMEYWRKALAMNPGLTEASRNLALALRAAGRENEASEVLRAASLFAPGVEK